MASVVLRLPQLFVFVVLKRTVANTTSKSILHSYQKPCEPHHGSPLSICHAALPWPLVAWAWAPYSVHWPFCAPSSAGSVWSAISWQSLSRSPVPHHLLPDSVGWSAPGFPAVQLPLPNWPLTPDCNIAHPLICTCCRILVLSRPNCKSIPCPPALASVSNNLENHDCSTAFAAVFLLRLCE